MPDIFALNDGHVTLSHELLRIANLPRREWSEDEAEKLADEMTDALKNPYGQMRLRPVQAVALYELGMRGGLFAPLPCGAGKTLVSLLAPFVTDAKRPLLLVPAKLVQKTQRDAVELRRHWKIPSRLTMFSYEFLGRIGGKDALDRFAPDLVIADECHRLRNRKASVTRRVRRFFSEHAGTMACVMSGTMTKRSLHDYATMLAWVFGMDIEQMPLPREWKDLELWADALDEMKGQLRRADPGALEILCNAEERKIWARDPRRAARSAYRRRLVGTEKVVSAEESLVDASLTISEVKVELPKVVCAAFEKLRTDWETPDGWSLMDKLEVYRIARQLSLGFYYVQVGDECINILKRCQQILKTKEDTIASIEYVISNVFENKKEKEAAREVLKSGKNTHLNPYTELSWNFMNSCFGFQEEDASIAVVYRGKRNSQSTMIMRPEKFAESSAHLATEQLRSSETTKKVFNKLFDICRVLYRPPKHWLSARKTWAKFVREKLANSHTLDSELQVRRTHADAPEYMEWSRVQSDFNPNTVPVWLDDFALKFCADWASRERGIVWTEHVVFGEALEDKFSIQYYGRKGLTRRGALIDLHPPGHALVASIQSNGEGRNLQAWNSNLITSAPANGKNWEQLLSRTHREGQLADEVQVDVLNFCAEHLTAFWQGVKDAQYVLDSTGAPQKILLAGKFFTTVDEWLRKIEDAEQPDWAWVK